jgi:hypothetical protein
MTTHQDVQRAGLRALMANPDHGLPEYTADPKTVGRVGDAISAAAGNEERHVRASDSQQHRFAARPTALRRSVPNFWLLALFLCTPVCTVGLGALTYWHFR